MTTTQTTQQAKRFTFHDDPGHAWLEVTIADLEDVGLKPDDFSTFSYLRSFLKPPTSATEMYLEEDCDAGKFIRAFEAKHGARPQFDELGVNEDSFIRSLPRNPGKKRRFGIIARRSAESVVGFAVNWCQTDGKRDEYDTRDEARKVAQGYEQSCSSPHVSYRAWEISESDGDGVSLSLLTFTQETMREACVDLGVVVEPAAGESVTRRAALSEQVEYLRRGVLANTDDGASAA